MASTPVPEQLDRSQPLYRQLMEAVRRRIEVGKLPAGSPAPSESDLIAEFGVSSTTARRCLNELAQIGLVQRVQGRGTFVSDIAALTACRHIGILYHDLVDLTDSFSADALRGVNSALTDANVEPMLIPMRQVRRSADHPGVMRALIERHRLDALLLFSPVPPKWLAPAIDAGMPMAAVNFSYDDPHIISVTCEQQAALPQIAEHIRDHGHRDVVVLKGEFEHDLVDGVTMNRIAEHEMDENWVIEPFRYFETNGVRRAVERHLAAKRRPTAFICYGYDVAMATTNVIRECGWSVPDDYSVVFVGVPAPYTRFTGTVVPIADMAAHGTQLLIDSLEGRSPQARKCFATTWNPGDTLGPRTN